MSAEKEIERRRDEAVRRALNTPPMPYKPKGTVGKSPEKPAKRATKAKG